MLDDALLDLLQPVMVAVEDLLRERQILLDLGLLVPGNREQPVEIIAHDGRLGRHRRHLAQLFELLPSLLARLLRELGALDLVLDLGELILSAGHDQKSFVVPLVPRRRLALCRRAFDRKDSTHCCAAWISIWPVSVVGHVADMPDRQVRANRTHAPQQPTSPTDHLVGTSERVGRISRPSRPGGRQIDNEIELGRLLDWNVGRLRPAQNRRASDQLSNSYRLFVRLKNTA